MLRFTFIFWTVIIIILHFELIQSRGGRGGRGGGSRGGGSRSGGSRSGGSRGGTRVRGGGGSRNIDTMIYRSNNYYTWARTRRIDPSVRYARSDSYDVHRAITLGLILSGPRHHINYNYDTSDYEKISVCFNEYSLYKRNVSVSPWFVCPWDDEAETECCDTELGEKCCKPESSLFNQITMALIIISTISFGVYIIGSLYNRFCGKKNKESDSEENVQINKDGDCQPGISVFISYEPANIDPSTNPTTGIPPEDPCQVDMLMESKEVEPQYGIEPPMNSCYAQEPAIQAPPYPPSVPVHPDNMPLPSYDEVVNKTHVV